MISNKQLYFRNLTGMKCSYTLCNLNLIDRWKCCSCENAYHDVCAMAANAKVKRDSFGKISVLAWSSCSVNFDDDLRPNEESQSEVAMDKTTSNSALVVGKKIPFTLDNKTLIILAKFRDAILNEITTFREDIAMVNTRIDGMQQNIAEHTSLIDQLSSKVDALEQKCEMFEKQALALASDQLLSKVEEK